MMTRLFKEIIQYFVSDLCLLNYYKKELTTNIRIIYLNYQHISFFSPR